MKIKDYIMLWSRRPLLSVFILTAFGMVIAIACRKDPVVNAEVVTRSSLVHQLTAVQSDSLTMEAFVEQAQVILTELTEDDQRQPSFAVDHLNIAYLYDEGIEVGDLNNSFAGAGLQTLNRKDSEWYKKIYQLLDKDPSQMCSVLGRGQSFALGKYNPNDQTHDPNQPSSWIIHEWKNVHAKYVDGSGNKIDTSSNAKAILSLANVYAYQNQITSQAEVLEYIEQLWNRSHHYQLSMGSVYYCQGCLPADWKRPVPPETTEAPEILAMRPENWDSMEEAERAEIEAQIDQFRASNSNAQISQELFNYRCPGHIDLSVTMRVYGLTEKKAIFTKDSVGSNKNKYSEQWHGWDAEHQQYAQTLYDQDWLVQYGLSVSPVILFGQPLSDAETQNYLSMLPADLVQERRDFIIYALESVGKIPYYWGGKPSAAGYEGNRFGTIVHPDYRGRVLRGLDCSGWINWVYWSVFNEPYPYEGTDGFVASGLAIKKNELLPGDIGVLPGEDSHAVVFLAWADAAKTQMYAIHDTGGSTNTVVVGIVNANWPYYRRMIQ